MGVDPFRPITLPKFPFFLFILFSLICQRLKEDDESPIGVLADAADVIDIPFKDGSSPWLPELIKINDDSPAFINSIN